MREQSDQHEVNGGLAGLEALIGRSSFPKRNDLRITPLTLHVEPGWGNG